MKSADETPLAVARGVHQRSDVTRVPEGFVRRAVNVIGSGTGMRRRPGYEQLVAGSDITALWSNGRRAFFVDAGTLKVVDSSGEVATLATGLVGRACFAQAGEYVYISSAQRNLRVRGTTVRPWAPDYPAGFASATWSAAGTLPQGEYTIGLSLIDDTGMEGPLLQVPLSGSGAITLTGLDIPAGHSLAVSLTLPDNAVLYRVGAYVSGTTSLTIATLPGGKPIDQRFLEPMPAGADALLSYNGRLYAVHGDAVFYSEALRYGLTRLDANYLLFDSAVDLAAPAVDGIYVCRGGETLFLGGADPAAFSHRPLNVPEHIPGSPSLIRPEWFGLEVSQDEAWCWHTKGGPVIALAGGQIVSLADAALKLPGAERASTAVLEHEGERFIVSATRNPTTDATVASDLVETAIIRNGRLVI